MEEWKSIVNYKNYKVSNFGNVMNKHGRILKPYLTENGYLRMSLCNVEQKYFFVHRLVLETFNPTEEDLECDHINHIKNDNRLCNLRWVTRSQNSRHRKKSDGCSSQYKGVTWCKKQKCWNVSCKIDKKSINLGRYDNEQEAAKSYNDFVISKGLEDFVILNEIN